MGTVHRALAIPVRAIPSRRTSCSPDRPTVPCRCNTAACLRHCFAPAVVVAVVGVASGFDGVAAAVAGGVYAVVAGGEVVVVADADAGLVVAAEFSVDDDNCWPCPLPFSTLNTTTRTWT